MSRPVHNSLLRSHNLLSHFSGRMASIPPETNWPWLGRTLEPTRWSLIKRVIRAAPAVDNRAADEFCRCYWYPLYAFLRHSGYPPGDAQDHVQSFLVRMLNDNLLALADPKKGRLRNFLITLLNRHVSARREREGAKKRGGRALHVPLEWAAAEDAFQRQGCRADSPEEAFRRALAVQLVSLGIAALRSHFMTLGRIPFFEDILPALEGPLPDDSCADIASRHGMRPGAVRTAILRMRERFRHAVKVAAAPLLGIPDGPGLDAELQELFCAPTRPVGL